MIRVPDYIHDIVPYPPGKPIEELKREYGIEKVVKLASNENPLGPSPKALEALEKSLGKINRYPDGSGYYLRRRLSQKLNVDFDGIVLGNGSNEIIEMVFKAFLRDGDEVLMPQPSFLVYSIAAKVFGAKAVPVALDAEHRIDLKAMAEAVNSDTRVVIINNPNNPTGTVVLRGHWEDFLKSLAKDIVVVLDEAYIEFVQTGETMNGIDYIGSSGPFVISIRTFSKIYGLAGLRIGYGLTLPEVADYLNRVRQPFNVNVLAQEAALAALDDDDFIEKTKKLTWQGLHYLYEELNSMGLKYIPTETNFFLIELPFSARQVYESLLKKGVIARPMDSYGLDRFIRISVGLPEENELFIRELKNVLEAMGSGEA